MAKKFLKICHLSQAYFLKAEPSERRYKGWTCGGAIVSSEYIITSAACVQDVKHMYVVAGYNKFVDADDMDKDECVKKRRKKVVFTCVPKAYEFEFNKIEKWATSDIAVVQVESPYDFNDQSYKSDCSYVPAAIRVNYERKYQEPGVEAMVLGWGHLEKWRSTTDLKSYNVEKLHYAPTTILDKVTCKRQYSVDPETDENDALLRIIDKYMICTLRAGNIDDRGELVEPSIPDLDGCITKIEKLLGANGTLCDEEPLNLEDTEEIPLEVEGSIIESIDPDLIQISSDEQEEGKPKIVYTGGRRNNSEQFSEIRRQLSRRNGNCQNDHGGPLVTWVGGHEVLIGVASLFKVVNRTCSGPYLFTSTQCNGRFLDCLLHGGLGNNTVKRRSCDGPAAEEGYELIERRISWIGHKDGPADNEKIETRPQVPISQYHFKKN